MTQAFNLSQLANNVDTAGDLNAAVGLYNQVPVANGGTGAASFTANAAIISNAGGTALSSVAAGANGNVLTSNGTTWTSAANVAATSVNTVIVGVASGTWTKPATVKSIKVTVVGGGGNGGTTGPLSPGSFGGGGGGAAIRFYPAASLPGPQPYTVGGASSSSSFGVAPVTIISATGGVSGANNNLVMGAGGIGSNGSLNIAGSGANSTAGGSSLFGGGSLGNNTSNTVGFAGGAYGGGGGGANGPLIPRAGGAGAAGVVIIEEFY